MVELIKMTLQILAINHYLENVYFDYLTIVSNIMAIWISKLYNNNNFICLLTRSGCKQFAICLKQEKTKITVQMAEWQNWIGTMPSQ